MVQWYRKKPVEVGAARDEGQHMTDDYTPPLSVEQFRTMLVASEHSARAYDTICAHDRLLRDALGRYAQHERTCQIAWTVAHVGTDRTGKAERQCTCGIAGLLEAIGVVPVPLAVAVDDTPLVRGEA